METPVGKWWTDEQPRCDAVHSIPYISVYGDLGEIARVHGNGKGHSIKRARIVAASEDLYKELRHLVNLLEPLELSGRLQVPGLATLNGARQALKKADDGVLATSAQAAQGREA